MHGLADSPSRVDEGKLPEGEFAVLSRREDEVFAARDILGTRGLYLDGTGSFASDVRLLSGRGRLLAPGTIFVDGKVLRARLPRAALPDSFEEAAATLGGILEESVRRRVADRKKVAISFSGGLDSSLVAMLAARHARVVLCSAFSKGALDERQSSRAAEQLGLEWTGSTVDREAVSALSKGMGLPFEPNVMDRALWAIYSTTARVASDRGAEVILLGQLADELFGGYRKYALEAKTDPRSAVRMMEEDVKGCATRGFIRDETACAAWVEPRFPFADSAVAVFAKAIPLEYKIRGEERKSVLRAAAMGLGLPESLANAPKKAAQFSSGIAKLAG